jgi:hypothetical protein
MRKLRPIFLLLALFLTEAVFAGRVGLVIQLNESELITKCVTIPIDETVKAGCTLNEFWCNVGTGNSTAETLLTNSGLKLGIGNPDPCFGKPLCNIEDVGCDASNCFCSSNFWGFFYLSGGSWQYSQCGISGFNVRDGDVIGFSGKYYLNGLLPSMHPFNELCKEEPKQVYVKPVRRFNFTSTGNCSNQKVVIAVNERGKGVIWELSTFVSFSKGYPDVRLGNGVEAKIIYHELVNGRKGGIRIIDVLESDRNGEISFIPKDDGEYTIFFEKEGFFSEYMDLLVQQCKNNKSFIEGESNRPSNNSSQENLENKSNESKQMERISLIVPRIVELGNEIRVIAISEDSKYPKNESVLITMPSGKTMVLETNESGEVRFIANEEGVYSYSVPDNLLSSYVATNVIRPTISVYRVPSGSDNKTTPLIAKATADSNDSILYVFTILIFIGFYLYFIKNKDK